jgi:hypothetical protein
MMLDCKPSDVPHVCHCRVVHACPIMVHPDPAVQAALAQLAEEIARYDDDTGSQSRLELTSMRSDGGSFTSVTAQERRT